MNSSQTLGTLAKALAAAQGAMDCIAEGAILNAMGAPKIRSGAQEGCRPLAERILDRVRFGATDCWHYVGPRNGFGYGRITHKGRLQMVHRLSYEAFCGPIPDGMSVLHSCDNRVCVNPSHLSLGTYSDNRRDCVRRGRIRLSEEARRISTGAWR